MLDSRSGLFNITRATLCAPKKDTKNCPLCAGKTLAKEMQVKKTIVLLILLLSGHATANELIFSCTTDKGKTIKVMKNDGQAQYLFYNKNNTLEIDLKNDIASMDTRLSEPEGSEIITSVPFKNGKFVYDVFTSTDRLTDEHPSHSGVIVSKGNEYLTTVKCNNDSIQGNLLDIE